MNIRSVIIIIFVIAFFVDLYFLVMSVYGDSQFSDRDKLRPREGISIGHNDNIRIDGIAFYIVNTRSTDSIMLRVDATFLNPENEGKIGIYFPYKVKISSNDPSWEKADFESGTAFLKKYSCNKEEYCVIDYDEQPEFELVPENSKFDSKNGYKHGVQIKIDNSVPFEVAEFFREYNMTKSPLVMSYDDSVKRQLTIIIPENVDNIHPIPIPDPDIFHNSGLDYSNTQLDWHVFKDNQAFFVDYELPDERKKFGVAQFNISLHGIILGLIVGLFGIALAIESAHKKPTMKNVKWPQREDD